jgi:hypothetical protein
VSVPLVLLWRSVAVVVPLLWIGSLPLPVAAYWNGGGLVWIDSIELLLVGWIAVLGGQIAWSANVVIWLAVAGLARARSRGPLYAWLVGGWLLLCADSALEWHRWDTFEIARYGPGYYGWITAVSIAGIALIVRSVVERRSVETVSQTGAVGSHFNGWS